VKFIVIGNGGREHALAWSLLRSPNVERVFCIPGNGGTATLSGAENVALAADDFGAIAQFAQTQGIDGVVVGPELPLSQGIADALRPQGIAVFGPTQAGAQIEASKSWAKQLMHDAQVPTARAETFTDAPSALAYLAEVGAPIVIKADGLAAGKGVTVALTLEEAQSAVKTAFSGEFGAAGERVLIEDYLTGQELSVLALTDGKTIRPLIPAQDHKRIGEGDTGPNTGGMGAYAPVPLATPALLERIGREVLEPTLAQLQARGIDYRGVLYAGLMITPEGEPLVIEFNCRFGDPETQAVLPLLDTPLADLVIACMHQTLAQAPAIAWKLGASACVVMASGGYPGPYGKGDAITSLPSETPDTMVFHAGTTLEGDHLQTSGGRVLAVTSTAEDFNQAFERVYEAIAQIQFAGAYYRRDIGYRVREISL
jgi:phosphoribosylamine--glycine ligase